MHRVRLDFALDLIWTMRRGLDLGLIKGRIAKYAGPFSTYE